MIGYNLDKNGRVIAYGIKGKFNYYTDGTEPFSINDIEDWKKDFSTGNWIYSPIIMIPQTITKLQAVSLLLQTGKYTDLMNALESDPTGVKRILFDAAHQLDRNSNMVNEMGIALGMSSDDIDSFFNEADKILI